MFRYYEVTFIVDAHLPEERIEASIDKVTKFIDNNGAKTLFVDRWGKRRLAYEIAKKQYGYYVYVRFEADGLFIKELERGFKLDDSILRYLIILVPKIVLNKETKRGLETKKVSSEDVSERKDEKGESSSTKAEPDSPDLVEESKPSSDLE